MGLLSGVKSALIAPLLITYLYYSTVCPIFGNSSA